MEGAVKDDESDEEDDIIFDGGLKVPHQMYESLFEYQRTGIAL